MSISSIASDSYQYDLASITSSSSAQRRGGNSLTEVFSRDSGPDTVAISDEARALLGKKVEQPDMEEKEELTFREKLLQEVGKTQSKEEKPIDELGVNLFSYMLDSLFMANLDESEQASRAAAEGQPAKQNNVLQDSGKTANMKKTMHDVMTGKVDISELPQAMALGASNGNSGMNAMAMSRNSGAEIKA